MKKNSDTNLTAKPLVVDLDGTLVNTDMLFESANHLIANHPFRFFYLLCGFNKGKAHLKAKLAEACQIDVTTLPYNPYLLSFLKQQKAAGRTIVLSTATHRILAETIASHLGLIDEVLATENGINLKSEAKRDLLVARFGEKGFDYIGNNHVDFPVWNSAHKAYIVSSSPVLIENVRRIGNLARVIPNGKPTFAQALFKALRPHQWVKNLLIIIPTLAAHDFSLLNVISLLIAFIVFCISASSVYVFNDLIDVANDRYHQLKRNRPFAAGTLSLLIGWMLWPILLGLAFVISGLALPGVFCVVLATYVVLSMAYSLKLKQIAILDVLILSVLYTLRIIAGAFAISISVSFWLLAFSIFIFLSLAFIKRYSELKSPHQKKKEIQIKGRGYLYQDLEIISSMGIAAGYLAVLILALYIQDIHTAALYPSPQFIWFDCPLLLYWISRAWLIASHGQMHHDPIIFAIRDPVSWVVGFCFSGVFGLAMVSL